jgi:hypothetical protein
LLFSLNRDPTLDLPARRESTHFEFDPEDAARDESKRMAVVATRGAAVGSRDSVDFLVCLEFRALSTSIMGCNASSV